MQNMDEHRLSFCLIKRLPSNIAEVIPDEGIEISLSMAEELHQYLVAMMGDSFAILVNKLNSYSVTFDAQLVIGLLEEARATAVVVYNSSGEMATSQIRAMSDEQEKRIVIFFDKGQAVDWLEGRMAALS